MSAPEPLRAAPPLDRRRKALDIFAGICGLPKIDRLVQRGEEAETAEFSMILADGRRVRIGTIDTLWSHAQLCKVLIVATQRSIPPMKPTEWAKIRDKLIEGVEVDKTGGERHADIVLEWLQAYAEQASNDPEGAMVRREPFVLDGHLYVAVTGFATAARRRSGASVKEAEIRRALIELGFERQSMNCGRGAKRTQVSYYHAALPLVYGEPE